MSGNVSPLPWTGNKACISESLLAFMPQHDTYIEPCCGSAEFLLSKPRAKREIINDYNGDIVNFFRVIQHNKAFLDFSMRMLFSANSEELFLENKALLSKDFKPVEVTCEEDSILEVTDEELNRAVAFFENQIYSFSSTGNSFGIDNRNIESRLPRIYLANSRLHGVCILNRDYKRVIDEQSSTNSFIFLDPPYRGTEKYYRNSKFDNSEHAVLFKKVAELDKRFNGSCKCLITYNNDPVIVKYAEKYGFDMHVIKRLHNMRQSINPGEMFEELLIANYDLKAQAEANRAYIFEQTRQLSLFDYNYDY